MKAIRYYRPFYGCYTMRLAGSIQKLCKSYGTTLCYFEKNVLFPMESLLSCVNHIEYIPSSDSMASISDFTSDYSENSVLILCLQDENDVLLEEIYDVLKKYEKKYVEEGFAQELPNFGHPEFIEIPYNNT